MKKSNVTYLLLIVFLILATSSIATSASYSISTNNQGLTWGITTGSQFNYSINVESARNYPFNLNEEIYVDVEEVPVIPEEVTDIRNVSWIKPDNYQIYFTNGTDWPGSIGFFSLNWGPMPIGNWSLVQELMLNATEPSAEIAWINTQKSWGYTITNTDSATVLDYFTMKFSKIDGVLDQFLSEYISEGETLIHQEVIREDYISSDQNNLLEFLIIGGIGTGLVVLVIAILIIKRRS